MKKKKVFPKVLLGVAIAVAAIVGISAAANFICLKKNLESIGKFEKVDNPDAVIPVMNEKEECVFKTGRELKTVNLTDIHLGGGWLSYKKDRMALNAVASMITAEKPDLVIVTGDIGYPVPFSSGTLNNMYPVKLFTALMEKLGVYYTVTFGNHDSEAYSYYSREKIGYAYEKPELKYSLFSVGPEDVDGVGNQIIRVENLEGRLIQALFLVDSHSYTDGDIFGIFWKYDNIHENQIEWYKRNVLEMQKENPDVKSLMFMHIPLVEFRDAFNEYQANGGKDSSEIKYISGEIHEKEPYVFCGIGEDDMFETVRQLGSTKAIIFGHDHKNNLALNYKGVDLIYNNSIDYLAYIGISKLGDYRGCSVININTDGTYSLKHESYYQDKYVSHFPKEEVTFENA